MLLYINRRRRRPRRFLPQLAHQPQGYELAPVQAGEELQENLGTERLHPGRTVGYRDWWGLSATTSSTSRTDCFPFLLGWRSTGLRFRHAATSCGNWTIESGRSKTWWGPKYYVGKSNQRTRSEKYSLGAPLRCLQLCTIMHAASRSMN